MKCPLLLLQGGRDYQITDEDLRAWRVLLGARPGVVYKRYPNAGHTFVDGQGVASPQDYQRAAQVSPAVIADVAAFMSSPSSAR